MLAHFCQLKSKLENVAECEKTHTWKERVA